MDGEAQAGIRHWEQQGLGETPLTSPLTSPLTPSPDGAGTHLVPPDCRRTQV